MDTQLIQDVTLKFETNQFQLQQKDENRIISIAGPDSGSREENQEPEHFINDGNALRKDKNGRSLLGQQYVWALANWLADYPMPNMSVFFSNDIYANVSVWLGKKTLQKERLVRIIVAKLTLDWKSLKKFNRGSRNKALAYFACSMEIWHYAFPKKLDTLLQDIGKMESMSNDPVSHDMDTDEKTNIEQEFAILCNLMGPGTVKNMSGISDNNDLIRIWLTASITKTLKEQTGLTGLFSGFYQKT